MPDDRKEQGAPRTCERCGSNPHRTTETEALLSPLAAACALAEFIRCEHGTWGVRQFLTSLACLIPYDMIEQLACKFGLPAPPRPPEVVPPVVPKQEKPSGMSPEQMLMMMNALGGGQKSSGLDPTMLMQLLGK